MINILYCFGRNVIKQDTYTKAELEMDSMDSKFTGWIMTKENI